jgi:hypothetical protein
VGEGGRFYGGLGFFHGFRAIAAESGKTLPKKNFKKDKNFEIFT